ALWKTHRNRLAAVLHVTASTALIGGDRHFARRLVMITLPLLLEPLRPAFRRSRSRSNGPSANRRPPPGRRRRSRLLASIISSPWRAARAESANRRSR